MISFFFQMLLQHQDITPQHKRDRVKHITNTIQSVFHVSVGSFMMVLNNRPLEKAKTLKEKFITLDPNLAFCHGCRCLVAQMIMGEQRERERERLW